MVKFSSCVVPMNGSTDAMFKFKNISMCSNNKTVLYGIFGTVCELEILGIVGDHQSGKRDLIKILSTKRGQLSAPYTGIISAHSKASLSESDTLPGYMTVYEIMEYYATMKGIKNPWIEEMLNVLSCDFIDLKMLGSAKFNSLTLFQRRLVKIACQYPLLHATLLLDEPFKDLSGTESAELMKMLKRISSGGCRIVLTFDTLRHESTFLIDNLMLLVRGVPVYYGPDWKNDLPSLLETDLQLVGTEHCTDLNLIRDHYTKMSYDLLVPDKRHSTDFDRPLPPYYKREASLNQLSVSTAVAIFHRILKQQSLKNEFYKIAMCSFLGVGIFSKHSHTSMYSQHWKICVAFLWAHITLAVSRFNSIYKESNVYAFEQKQRFYSPILYTIVHSMFDLVWDGLLSISFSTFLYLLLTSVDYGLKDHIPAEFMLFWGASMQLCTTLILKSVISLFYNRGFENCLYISSVVLGFQIAACGVLASTDSMSSPFMALHFLSFPSHALHATFKLLEVVAHPSPEYVQLLTMKDIYSRMLIHLAALHTIRSICFTRARRDFKKCSLYYLGLCAIAIALVGVLVLHALH